MIEIEREWRRSSSTISNCQLIVASLVRGRITVAVQARGWLRCIVRLRPLFNMLVAERFPSPFVRLAPLRARWANVEKVECHYE
jgi:hypothetical protein